MKTQGHVFKYPDNVDTDVIIPARYLNTADAKELARHCMEDIDNQYVNRVKNGDVMVAGWNFGCGSSREHAPLVIKTCGTGCVIAKSFARIFYRNAINIGLPILECEAAAEEIQAGDEVAVDFDTGIISDLTTGKTYQAEPFPEFIQNIIRSGGLLASLEGGVDMLKNIAVIPGDGIGPEIVSQAVLVLNKVADLYGHRFTYTQVDMGGNAIDKWGDPLPQEMLQKCIDSDSVLLGAVGGPKWNDVPGPMRPEKGLLRLRADMGVYSNNRPARIWPQLASASPLKQSIVDKGIDFIIVRELIGGIYFGKHETVSENDEKVAVDELRYSESEIRRIGRIGFETAQKRNKKLCSVEKSNVLDSSRLWKKVMVELAPEYPDVQLSHMLVDNCAMQIVKDPSQFDVIVTENMFGDILSDEASMITGSIGMIPSSSLGSSSCGLYEPIHGSAPDIAGMDIANPIGTILSAAMMLRFSFDMAEEADAIESAVSAVLDEGYRTGDILPADPAEAARCTKVGCTEMGRLILQNIKKG